MKYPNGKKTNNYQKTPSWHGQRGMSFEQHINESNAFYLHKKIACIHKKPTPIQIVKVNYKGKYNLNENKHAVISEAYFQKPSTTDYNGIYDGVHIDFEVKECNSLSTFNLRSIHKHQIEHMLTIDYMNGIAFVLIYFKKLSKVALVDVKIISELYGKQATITFLKLSEVSKIFELSAYPTVDYLKYVRKLYASYFE